MGSGGHPYIASVGEQDWAVGTALVLVIIVLAAGIFLFAPSMEGVRWYAFSPANPANYQKPRKWPQYRIWLVWPVGIALATVVLALVLLYPSKFLTSASDGSTYQRMPTVLVWLIFIDMVLVGAWGAAARWVDLRPLSADRLAFYENKTVSTKTDIDTQEAVEGFNAKFNYYFAGNGGLWWMILHATLVSAIAWVVFGCIVTVNKHGSAGPYVTAALLWALFSALTVVALAYTVSSVSYGHVNVRTLRF
jgi:hypothetical protein